MPEDKTKFASVKEVGAMPFILFEYYCSFEGEIKPTLEEVAKDMGLKKNAVCNLRARLIKAGWIRYESDEVFILKSFTKNECGSQIVNDEANDSQFVNDHSQKMNETSDDSQKMNDSFTNCEPDAENTAGTELAKIGFGLNTKQEGIVSSNKEGFETSPSFEVSTETEKAIKISLDIDTQTRITEVVPIKLKTEWLELVKNRMVGNHGAHRNFLLSKIGLWLGDFQTKYKKEIEASPPPVPTMTMEEKKKRFALQSYNRPRPEIYVN